MNRLRGVDISKKGNVPVVVSVPALPADKAASGVPRRRVGSTSTIATTDVAATFGPVLEVVPLALLDGDHDRLIRVLSESRGGKSAAQERNDSQEGELDHCVGTFGEVVREKHAEIKIPRACVRLPCGPRFTLQRAASTGRSSAPYTFFVFHINLSTKGSIATPRARRPADQQ